MEGSYQLTEKYKESKQARLANETICYEKN